jgi:hypothetical protein
MSDNEFYRLTEIERVANRKPGHFEMDEAFCARMRAAMAAGLESPPVGVVTTPGTQNPKYAKYHRPRDGR